MVGTLYLCATPIGNLEDITLRVLRVLQEVDLIAAEDTRTSYKLLQHYEITTPTTSYHEHNQKSKGPYLIQKLKEGLSIALITDAGTPGISDPGEDLVRMCYEHGIHVTALPGATALITGLTLSGKKTRRFVFEGFLASDKKEREFFLSSLKQETRTVILYEAPHRLKKTLTVLYDTIGNRNITICRELTKRFEEVIQTNLLSAIEKYTNEQIKGECVIIIEGIPLKELEEKAYENWGNYSIKEHLEMYTNQGIEKKEAMKLVAKDRGVSRRDVYQSLLR